MIIGNVILLFSLFLISQGQSTLRFVQVWFRHGERLPTHYLQFTRDPPSDAYLDIAEPGELTNRGIQQEYQLGQDLKEKYGDFLGEYVPSQLHTYTGVDNRTVTSAQALMAALFPPSSKKQWNPNLLWQPISMHTDKSIDWVSTGIEIVCPKYQNKLFNSDEYKAIPSQLDQNVLTYIRNATGGVPRDDTVDVNRVIDSLRVRNFLNDSRLPYPKWAEPVRSKLDSVLTQLHSKVLDLQNTTVGGYHLEKTLSYFEDHLQRSHQKINKAVFIAGHDTNLGAMGKAWKISEIEEILPFYGAHLAIELHLIEGNHTVQFFYSSGAGKKAIKVQPEFCGEPCSLERLQQLTNGFRVSASEMIDECKGNGSDVKSITFGVLLGLAAIFLLTTVILGCTSYSYKKQLRELNDPERRRLL